MAKMGYVLMRYGLDESGNEISGTALCASASHKKVYDKIRSILDLEKREANADDVIHDYDTQVVVMYGGDYEDENGVRYIIEGLEIL